MSFHEDQIKKKLLEVDIDHFRKYQLQPIMLHQISFGKAKKLPFSELSEWATSQKTTALTSFPYLQFASQSLRKNKIMQNTPSQMSSQFVKTNTKFKDQASIPNPINLSFNPESVKKRKSKNKRTSNLLPKQSLKSLQKEQKFSFEKYLINGEIRTNQNDTYENLNTQNRSDHLLKLLRQREMLRRKRYSFDIDGGFVTKSYFYH